LPTQHQLGLCDECFGPLYVTAYDPEGKALRRRVERRLLQQLMAGCGKSWCANYGSCRDAERNARREGGESAELEKGLTAKEALPIVRPVVERLLARGGEGGELFFCVDRVSQWRRGVAEGLAGDALEEAADGLDAAYEVEWWVEALEEVKAAGGDVAESEVQVQRAREWLADRAPRRGEVLA